MSEGANEEKICIGTKVLSNQPKRGIHTKKTIKMTRGEDLHTLGLSSEDDEAQDSQRKIRKAFLRLSRKHHPDKGGTNEGFQKLSEAYYRLRDEEA